MVLAELTVAMLPLHDSHDVEQGTDALGDLLRLFVLNLPLPIQRVRDLLGTQVFESLVLLSVLYSPRRVCVCRRHT